MGTGTGAKTSRLCRLCPLVAINGLMICLLRMIAMFDLSLTTKLDPITHFTHFRVALSLASLSKRGLVHNHSHENEFNLHVNETSFSYERWAPRLTLRKRIKVSNSEMAFCAPNPPCPNKQNRKKNRLVFVKRIYCLNCLLILPSLILRVFSRIFEPELKKAKCVSEFDRKGLVKWFLQFRATFVTKACVKRRNKATLN